MDIVTVLYAANEFGLMAWIQSQSTGGHDRDQHRHVARAARVAARRIQRRYDAATLAAIQQAIGQPAGDALRRPAGRSTTARR
jgi:hypothetical protein